MRKENIAGLYGILGEGREFQKEKTRRRRGRKRWRCRRRRDEHWRRNEGEIRNGRRGKK